MENITVDHSITLQADAGGMDTSLEAAVDRHALRNDVAVELRTMADQNICGAELALDTTVDVQCTLAVNFSDDRHAWAESGDLVRWLTCIPFLRYRRRCNTRLLRRRRGLSRLGLARWRLAGWRHAQLLIE